VLEDCSLTDDWVRSVASATEEAERRRQLEQQQREQQQREQRQRGQREQPGRAPAGANAGGDDPPPF
jgi:hypothetical protein